MSIAEWESIGRRNLKQSGIESTFDLLTSYSIRRAQINRLKRFDDRVPVHMRGLLAKLK